MNSRGFTLIEVIIAIAISAMVASLAYQTLHVATEATQRTSKIAKRIDHIDRAWQLLETDLRHAVERSGTSPFDGREVPPLEGGSSSEYLLYFIRGGWANPLGQTRSSMQRVGYKLQDNILWRHYWAVVDGVGNEEPLELDILKEVKGMRVRFLSPDATDVTDNQWQPLWPVVNVQSEAKLPAAVEVTLELEDMGEITRIFSLSAG